MGALFRSLLVLIFMGWGIFTPQQTSASTHPAVGSSTVMNISRGATLLLNSDPRPFSRWANDHLKNREKPLLWIFLEALFLGILAVFTPYVYAILPITMSYISVITTDKSHVQRNSFYYAVCLISIFVGLGLVLSVLISTTGFYSLADHWIFNLFFCRIFFMLGLSFLGAFEINLPVRWAYKINQKAGVDSLKQIFFMALSLPVVTISSTGPIAGLILLFAGKGGFAGPIVGMLGFSLGFVMPFVFPVFLNLVSKSVTWLNHVKVLLGFSALLIGLKFLSNADISLGWNLIDNDIFISLIMGLSAMMGLYMLGYVRLTNDYLHIQNVYGQEYISISRLVLAVAFFTFSVYLLPGLWGAPLHAIHMFLPQAR